MFNAVLKHFLPSQTTSVMITTGPCKAPPCAAGFCDAGQFNVPAGEFPPSALFCVKCDHTWERHETTPERVGLPRQTTSRSDIENHIRSVDPATLLPPTHTDSNIYVRPNTIKNLWAQLLKEGILSARATPTAGKSTLGKLLKSFVELNFPEVKVIRFDWMGEDKNGNLPLPIYTPYQKIFREYAEISDIDRLLETKVVVIIVDEAQNSYPYGLFWDGFIKGCAAEVGSPYTLLLSSFGSPGAVVTEFKGSTPFHFSPGQRISARSLSESNTEVSLYLKKPEFDNVIALLNKNRSPHLQYTPDAIEYLFSFTSGHIGAVRFMQDFLHEEMRPFLRAQTRVDSSAIQDTIFDDVKSFVDSIMESRAPFQRSVIKEKVVRADPELAKALKITLSTGALQTKDPADEFLQANNPADKGILKAYQKGYLQAEIDTCGETVYVFPSHIHRLCVEHRLMSSLSFPSNKFSTLESLVLASVQHFSSAALRAAGNILSTGSQPLPVEASYQSELYRTIYKVLGNQCFVTSEFSASRNGRIDFVLKIPGWGIEALREGTESTLKEHVGRFDRGGKYQQWISKRHLKEGCVVDFRTSMPEFPTMKEAPCMVYHVVYDTGFEYCAVYTYKGKKVLEKFVLPKN